MKKTITLEVTITIDDEYFDVEVTEPESGCNTKFQDIPYMPDEHLEFNEAIGNEVYSWVSVGIDELNEEEAE